MKLIVLCVLIFSGLAFAEDPHKTLTVAEQLQKDKEEAERIARGGNPVTPEEKMLAERIASDLQKNTDLSLKQAMAEDKAIVAAQKRAKKVLDSRLAVDQFHPYKVDADLVVYPQEGN